MDHNFVNLRDRGPLPVGVTGRTLETRGRVALRFAGSILAVALVLQRFAIPVAGESVQIVGPLGLLLAGGAWARGALAIDRARLRIFGLFFTCLLIGAMLQAVVPNSFGVTPNAASLSQFALLTAFCVLTFTQPVGEIVFIAGASNILLVFAVAGILQFISQFAGLGLFAFTGLVPDRFLFESGYNLAIPVGIGDTLKANGFFLLEPSIFSQAMAFGVILESIGPRRAYSSAAFLVALVLSFSGTGWMVLAAFIVFSGARLGRRGLTAICVLIGLIVVVLVTAVVVLPDLGEVFMQRLAEFSEPGTSGNLRFVTPLRFVADVLAREPLAPFFGLGAGTSERITLPYAYNINTPIKIFVEYGLPALLLYIALFLRAERTRVQAALVAPALTLTFLTGGYQQFPAVLFPIFLLIVVARLEPQASAREA